MKLEKLTPGMTVYDVGRHKMGNTTLSTISVWSVYIVYVNYEKGTVLARWNGNQEKTYHRSSWAKWRAKKPMLVRQTLGNYRLATKAEIAAAIANSRSGAENARPA